MKYEERQVRNNVVIKLSELGMTQEAIGAVVNLGQRMISTLLNKWAQNLPLTTKSQGSKRQLSASQLSDLPKFLIKGAESYGFEGKYWTHTRVGYVINREFQVQYEDKQVGRILKKINWTWQKPQKKEVKQSLAKVEQWQKKDLPALKKKAIEEGYDIYYHDESTLQLHANIVKTYSPRGETPVLGLYDTKGYQYVCIASSINTSGKMFFQIREKSFKGDAIIEYLKNLLDTTTKKILLIWDNASWHKSEEVKTFLNTEEGKRLWVANTPPYSPEFNPDELVWANLKRVQIPNRVAKNIKELKIMAHNGMLEIQNSEKLIKSFFNKKNFYFTDF
jgi:transposase